jgi:hypothetical protein
MLFALTAIAKTIPDPEFIAITENVMDVLDEIDVLLHGTTIARHDLRQEVHKLAILLRKYEHSLGPDGAFDKEQGEITSNFVMIESSLSTSKLSIADIADIDNFKKKAIDLFLKYKEKHGGPH